MAFRKLLGIGVLGTGVAGGLRHTSFVPTREFVVVEGKDETIRKDFDVKHIDYGLFSFVEVDVRSLDEIEIKRTERFCSYSPVNLSVVGSDYKETDYPAKYPFGFGSN